MEIWPRSLGAAALLLVASSQVQALDVLLTNDDGWDSLGIQAMKDALINAGHSVYLVASLTGQSGSSAALNFESLQIVKQTEAGGPEYSVALGDGVTGAEPATCTAVGIGIMQTSPAGMPDLVVSGINAGQNLGAASQISGTVGAATVAISSAIGGAQVPAIAVSTDEVCDDETPACAAENAAQYARVADFVAEFIDSLASRRGRQSLTPQGVGLNINYPAVETIEGATINRQGQTFSIGGQAISLTYGCYEDCIGASEGVSIPGGLTGFAPIETKEVKNADTTDNANGYITIVPIYADFTAGFNTNEPGHNKFRADLKKAVADMGY